MVATTGKRKEQAAIPLTRRRGAIATGAAANPPNWVTLIYSEAQKAVGLRWTPVPGATGYEVLRRTASGKDYVEIASVAVQQHFDKNVEPGTTYYYVLQSVDAAGPSPNSAERSVAIPGEKRQEALRPPEWDKVVPQSITQFGNCTARIGLFWKAVKGNVVAYNICRSLTSGSAYALIASVAETPFVDTSGEVGKTSYYVLSALDATTFAETPYSAEKTAEIPPAGMCEVTAARKSSGSKTSKLRFAPGIILVL